MPGMKKATAGEDVNGSSKKKRRATYDTLDCCRCTSLQTD